MIWLYSTAHTIKEIKELKKYFDFASCFLFYHSWPLLLELISTGKSIYQWLTKKYVKGTSPDVVDIVKAPALLELIFQGKGQNKWNIMS